MAPREEEKVRDDEGVIASTRRRVRSPKSYRHILLPNEMNDQAKAVTDAAAVNAPGYRSATLPFYWSIRREVWENRFIYIAPLIVAAVALFGFLISSIGLPERRRAVLLLDPAKARAGIEAPYDITAIMLILTAFVVGFFYCLDALYGERRERSILFWKSLPVSDRTTVLSKTSIPLVVLPLVTFATILATQLVMLLWTSTLLVSHGMSPASTWTHLPLIQNSLLLLYGLAAIALWHAPIYGWALLVSGWVRRATFLWAVLPPIAIAVFEKITFNTSHFAALVKDRVLGFAPNAFAFGPHRGVAIDSLVQLTPGRYLGTPGLWLGLLFAAVCVIAAIRLRRYRGPL
jgi:ABC-2 type transport system permease protein